MSQHSSRGTTWAKARLAVLERDMHICVYCGAEATQVDHITPRASGGGDEMSNLVAACQPCNNRKSDKHMPRVNYYNPIWLARL